MKLLMKLEGPLSCHDPGGFQTLFLTLFTHKSYHRRVGSQELFAKDWSQQGIPLESVMPCCPGTPGIEGGITAIRVRGGLRSDQLCPLPGHRASKQESECRVSPIQSCQALTCPDLRSARHCARHLGSQSILVVELERYPRSPDCLPRTFPAAGESRAAAHTPSQSSLLEVMSNEGGTQVFPSALLGWACGLSHRLSQDWAFRRGAPRPRNSLET